MSDAFAAYNLCGLQIVRVKSEWVSQFAAIRCVLEAFEEAKMEARQRDDLFDYRATAAQRDAVGHELWDAGTIAEARCGEFHKRIDGLVASRSALLHSALYAMGFHYGSMMKADNPSPADPTTFKKRYWRHAKQMARTLRANMPGNKVVGPSLDFDSTRGWAAALGMRTAKELVERVYGKGFPDETARSAGPQACAISRPRMRP